MDIKPVPDPVTQEEAKRWLRQAHELVWRRPLSMLLITVGVPVGFLLLVSGVLGALVFGLTGQMQMAYAAVYGTSGVLIVLGAATMFQVGGMLMAGVTDHGASRWYACREYMRLGPAIAYLFRHCLRQSPVMLFMLAFYIGLKVSMGVALALQSFPPTPVPEWIDLFAPFVGQVFGSMLLFAVALADQTLPWHYHGLIAEGLFDRNTPPSTLKVFSITHQELLRPELRNRWDYSRWLRMGFVVAIVLSLASDFTLALAGTLLLPYFSAFCYVAHRDRFRGKKENQLDRRHVTRHDLAPTPA